MQTLGFGAIICFAFLRVAVAMHGLRFYGPFEFVPPAY